MHLNYYLTQNSSRFQRAPFMKLQSNPCPFFSVLLLSMSVAISSSHSQAQAQVNKGDLASAGLVVHWESNIGGAPLANGSQSFVLWAHTTEKREYVTVRNAPKENSRVAIKSETLGLPLGSIGLVTKVISDGARFEVELDRKSVV